MATRQARGSLQISAGFLFIAMTERHLPWSSKRFITITIHPNVVARLRNSVFIRHFLDMVRVTGEISLKINKKSVEPQITMK
jgi:hypothetical protein